MLRSLSVKRVSGLSARPPRTLSVAMISPSSSAWSEYRRRNRAASLGLVLGLPCAVALAIVAKVALHVDVIAVFATVTIAWSIWWGWAALRAVRSPCPRCGVPYLADQESWERRCGKCALKLCEDL
jgi:ribosomal protein S27AE